MDAFPTHVVEDLEEPAGEYFPDNQLGLYDEFASPPKSEPHFKQ